MLSTIPRPRAARSSHADESAPARAAGALERLDAALFRADSWRPLTSSNVQIRHLHPRNLREARQLVETGHAATWYGELHEHVRVVDIDMEVDGLSVLDTLEAWADARGLWTLSRPSGGSGERAHLFVLTRDQDGDHADALERKVADLRAEYEVPHHSLEVRSKIRPLTAPHRTGTITQPWGVAVDSVQDLRRRTAVLSLLQNETGHLEHPGKPAETAREARVAGQRGNDGRVPLETVGRRRRDLPREWAQYLATGVAPVLGGRDQTRTAVEAVAIGAMVRAGWDWRTALRAIFQAHPAAMQRARTGGTYRLMGIWNRAVIEDTQYAATLPRTVNQSDPHVSAAVHAARARLWDFAATLSRRCRGAVLRVGHALLDRIEREGRLRVPCAERTLVEDTGLSRPTVRAARDALHGALGVVHRDCLGPRATTSFEFELDSLSQGGEQLCPPSSHTPHAPPGTWSLLPPAAPLVWRRLTEASVSRTSTELVQLSLLTSSPTAAPTSREISQAERALQALQHAGLAELDDSGRWRSRGRATTAHTRQALTYWSLLRRHHETEQQLYRGSTGTDWATQRCAALQRNQDRQRRWWLSLSAEERAVRSRTWAHRFDQLSTVEQARVKDALAQRRSNAGVTEDERLRQWRSGWSDEEFEQRRAERHHRFWSEPAPLRRARAAMWEEHRRRWTHLRS